MLSGKMRWRDDGQDLAVWQWSRDEMDLQMDSPQDLILLFKRRRRVAFLGLNIGIILTVLVALLWPPIYESSATIIIEEPEVPQELVSSTVTSYADQRIQVIAQRVLSTPNLIAVVEKYNLYVERRKKEPIGAIIIDMRGDVKLSLISADVVDPRSRKTASATIAFTLAFSHRNPRTAQKVLNELVSSHLAENLRSRRLKAQETTGFLSQESRKYQELVKNLETKVAAFKTANSGSLPEQIGIKTQVRERTERELLNIRRRLQNLYEREIYLKAELSQLTPTIQSTASGDAWDPVERLRTLQSQVINLKSSYGPEHPDVKKLEREISLLQAKVGPDGNRVVLEQERDAILEKLSEATQKYSSEHPDVQKLKRQLQNVEQSLSDTPAGGNNVARPAAPNNPVYIQLKADLAAAQSERQSLVEQSGFLNERLQGFDDDLLRAPEIEREYRILLRDYETALNNAKQVEAKLTTAELGEALEIESKAEQFSLIEPPSTPTAPAFPNYLALLALGVAASLGLGGGGAVLTEVMDSTVAGPRQLAKVTGAPPLMVIPRISNRTDTRRRHMKTIAAVLAALAILLVGLWSVHVFVMPLDVLWAVIERRLDLVFFTIVPR